MCMCTYVCVYMHIHICIYIFMHILHAYICIMLQFEIKYEDVEMDPASGPVRDLCSPLSEPVTSLSLRPPLRR